MEGKIEETGSRWMPLKNINLVKEIGKVNPAESKEGGFKGFTV